MREDSILNVLKEDCYRINDCQILLYDRTRVDVFPEGYLSKLYKLAQLSGRRSQFGILPNLFCGMPDLSHDAITTYLASRPIIVPVIWSGETFLEAGFGFPTTVPMLGNRTGPDRAAFMGYGLFKGVWGLPEATILGMLGLTYFFLEFDLGAIHGLRYAENALTARFTHQFGFKDNGFIPRYMLRDGRLVGAVSSTLLVEHFESYVEHKLVELWKSGELDGRRQGRRTKRQRTAGNAAERDRPGQHRPAASDQRGTVVQDH